MSLMSGLHFARQIAFQLIELPVEGNIGCVGYSLGDRRGLCSVCNQIQFHACGNNGMFQIIPRCERG